MPLPRGQNHQYSNCKLYKPTFFQSPFFCYLSVDEWTWIQTCEQIHARNNRAAVVSVPLPAPPFPGAGRAQTAIMIVLHDINRPLSSCLYNARVHIGAEGLSWEHERTLTLIELAIIMQIPLLGVSVLPAFGPKIASTATTGDVNPFLFTCCFRLIF